MANRSLAAYQRFIDDMVKLRKGVLVRWVKEKGWPKLPENEPINRLLSELSGEQKDVVAQIIQEARDGGVHDVLAYLDERINFDKLRIVADGVELAVEPYGTEMHFDWVARREGMAWPDGDLKEAYKVDDS